MATSATARTQVNWNFYEDKPAMVSSTKPTDFQQHLNDTDAVSVPLEGCLFIGTGGTARPPNKAKTYDEGKEPLAWLPWAAIDELSKVQMYGHNKYKDLNNYRKGMEVSRNLSCALRHIRDYLNGQDRDHESNCSPLAHALCRIAFVLQNIHDGVAIDDRYKPATPIYQEVVDGESLIKEWGRQKP